MQPRSDEVRHGSSLAALIALGKEYGYVLAETTTFNAFFVDGATRAALACEGLLRPDDDIDTLHDVTMGTAMYQLYDGTLKLHGCKKLLWHRLPIDEGKIQIVAQKAFPFQPNGTSNGAKKKPNKRRSPRGKPKPPPASALERAFPHVLAACLVASFLLRPSP